MAKHSWNQLPLGQDNHSTIVALVSGTVQYLDLCDCGLNGQQQLLYKWIIHIIVAQILLHKMRSVHHQRHNHVNQM